jgi:hypothetical protein
MLFLFVLAAVLQTLSAPVPSDPLFSGAGEFWIPAGMIITTFGGLTLKFVNDYTWTRQLSRDVNEISKFVFGPKVYATLPSEDAFKSTSRDKTIRLGSLYTNSIPETELERLGPVFEDLLLYRLADGESFMGEMRKVIANPESKANFIETHQRPRGPSKTVIEKDVIRGATTYRLKDLKKAVSAEGLDTSLSARLVNLGRKAIPSLLKPGSRM